MGFLGNLSFETLQGGARTISGPTGGAGTHVQIRTRKKNQVMMLVEIIGDHVIIGTHGGGFTIWSDFKLPPFSQMNL